MAQDLGAFTNAWMSNPYMFEPSQVSNAFSNFNNAALPWPPSYNGVPVNAATGKPIQSFLDWQQANPGGVSLNSTPSQPQQQAAPYADGSKYGNWDAFTSPTQNWNNQQAAGNQQRVAAINAANPNDPAGAAFMNAWMNSTGAQPNNPFIPGMGGGGMQMAAPQQPQASGPPNNWQAAINALANPGNPMTQGANVPLATGSQPAGGVNQAWLGGIGMGQGMNQNFVNALRSIQARPQ